MFLTLTYLSAELFFTAIGFPFGVARPVDLRCWTDQKNKIVVAPIGSERKLNALQYVDVYSLGLKVVRDAHTFELNCGQRQTPSAINVERYVKHLSRLRERHVIRARREGAWV